VNTFPLTIELPAVIATGQIFAIHLTPMQLNSSMTTKIAEGVQLAVVISVKRDRLLPDYYGNHLTRLYRFRPANGVPVIGVDPNLADVCPYCLARQSRCQFHPVSRCLRPESKNAN
jgi:hypothetical protein